MVQGTSCAVLFLSILLSVSGPALGATKVLKGSVEGGIYYAPNNLFSVRIPYQDQSEWLSADVIEFKTPDRNPNVGVIFGPSAEDPNIYDAVFVPLRMEDDKDFYVQQVFSRKLAVMDGHYLQMMEIEKFTVNGRSCYYVVYEGSDIYVVFSLIDAGPHMYVIDGDVPKSESRYRVSLETLLARRWDTLNAMIESFSAPSEGRP